MLFNKSQEGTAELRKHISFLYASVDFEEMATDLKLAEEDMIRLIGEEVYTTANNYYLSDDYDNKDNAILNQLVEHIQLPVALFGAVEYSKSNDVSHESSGRRVKLDPEREKLPFEWMLDRDSASILRKAHKTTDRLIAFLEKHPKDTKWATSKTYKITKSLFINTAEEFDEYYPIDKSRQFFLKLVPFINRVEHKQIKATIGNVRFSSLHSKLQDRKLEESDRDLLRYIRETLVLASLSRAIGRMAVELIPESIYQNFIPELNSSKTSQNNATARRELAVGFKQDAEIALRDLQDYVKKLNAPKTYNNEPISVTPNNPKERGYFRT